MIFFQANAIDVTIFNEEDLKDEKKICEKMWGFIVANKWRRQEEKWTVSLMGFTSQDILVLEYAKAAWSFGVSRFPEYKEMGRFLETPGLR